MAASPLQSAHVELLLRSDAAWIQLSGEVDLAAAPVLHKAIDDALVAGLPVWLNLIGVTFLDSSCVHEVLYAQLRAAARGTCLLVIPPAEPRVMLPFHLLELADRLPFVDLPHESPSRDHLRGLPSMQGTKRRRDEAVARLPTSRRGARFSDATKH